MPRCQVVKKNLLYLVDKNICEECNIAFASRTDLLRHRSVLHSSAPSSYYAIGGGTNSVNNHQLNNASTPSASGGNHANKTTAAVVAAAVQHQQQQQQQQHLQQLQKYEVCLIAMSFDFSILFTCGVCV